MVLTKLLSDSFDLGGPYLETDEDSLRFPHLAKVPPIKNDHMIVIRSFINTTPVL